MPIYSKKNESHSQIALDGLFADRDIAEEDAVQHREALLAGQIDIIELRFAVYRVLQHQTHRIDVVREQAGVEHEFEIRAGGVRALRALVVFAGNAGGVRRPNQRARRV